MAESTDRASHRIVMADGVVSWENMIINLDLQEFLFICEEGFVWQSPYLGPEL